MLDNGFYIKNFEMHNWGNFNGYQKFSLRGQSLGGLFAEPASSAILGVNGSGKSTIIDGFMIVMLPFEKSLKLGVTNDVETGSSGGRSIKDYVLGKYASMGSLAEVKHEDIYSRKTGCSILLINFGHASVPNRQLTIGRLWWYRDGRVLDNSQFFISHKDLTMNDLCAQGNVPTNAKSFKEEVAKKISGIELYETSEAYFSSLSACLGSLKKDDLKLLNRAFYVKSISNIDSFIRENMLIENESPHLDILLQNVRSGQEISETIRICEIKIDFIQNILKNLEKMKEVSEKLIEARGEVDLLSLYPDWRQIEQIKIEINDLKQKINHAQIIKPELHLELQNLELRYQQVQIQLNNDQTFQQIQLAQERIKQIQDKVDLLSLQKKNTEAVLKNLSLSLPKQVEDIPNYLNQISDRKNEIQLEKGKIESFIEAKSIEKQNILQLSDELKQEIKHLQQNKSLIHPEIYRIKIQACEELQIPRNHLMFVGELLNISKANQTYRLAAESVLDPISRNLLCHPDDLDRLTQWLNKKQLNKTIIVKRIKKDDLIILSKKQKKDKSILNSIDILPNEQNIFHDYIQHWLIDMFDYQIIHHTKDFSKLTGQLVTLEGLVKSDERTMKKMKSNLRFSIGWDPIEKIEENIESLKVNQTKFDNTEAELSQLKEKQNVCGKNLHAIEQVCQASSFEYLLLLQFKKQKTELENDILNLKKSDRDIDRLKEDFDQLKVLLEEKKQSYYDLDAQLNLNLKYLSDRSKILPEKERQFYQTRLVQLIHSDEDQMNRLFSYLTMVDKKISQGQLFANIQSQLLNKIESLSNQRELSAKSATIFLEKYKAQFNDVNLTYRIPDGDVSFFVQDWQKAYDYLESTELVTAKYRFREYFDRILIDSIKATVNEFKTQEQEIQKNINSINEVLKITNYETLPDEERYLQIMSQRSPDERIHRFRARLKKIETLLAPSIRQNAENISDDLMTPLMTFVEDLQKDTNEKYFVTDIRNHFLFQVHSYQRIEGGIDIRKEEFSGARKDAKSSAQTTQLAYSLLASSLAYRFKFNDPIAGKNTLRTLILDEFGGKFDNEKPRDIVQLLEKMGFQPILVSPMSKADLLADHLSHLVMVHKSSAKESKVCSYPIMTRSEYERVLLLLSDGNS